jgi:hypothetical protein
MQLTNQPNSSRRRILRPELVVRLAGVLIVGLSFGQLGWVAPTLYGLATKTIEQAGSDYSMSGYVGSFFAVIARQFESLDDVIEWASPITQLCVFFFGCALVRARGGLFRFACRRVSQWLTTPGFAS